MKSNGKYVFFFDLVQSPGPYCRSAKLYSNMPLDVGHVIILTSSIHLQHRRMHDLWKNSIYMVFLRLKPNIKLWACLGL